ncbi:MAG: glycerol-3-phosphate 1-O-acyltransferase PlsY [bacterium]|nr:glycerol-3-phosphate 1-O-acyltransferase PlsY [bacterium]
MGYLTSFIVGLGFGSIPFGYIFAKLGRGIDIREHGSKNIGATNVWRICGKPLGITVFLLDAIKGFLPTFIFSHWFGTNPAIISGIGAILGHSFTPWLKFKGGKGVSTGLGVFIGLTPLGALIAFLVWCILLLALRWVSVASMGAATVLVVFIFIRDGISPIFFIVIVAFVLIIYLHRSNILRLIQGSEPRIGR